MFMIAQMRVFEYMLWGKSRGISGPLPVPVAQKLPFLWRILKDNLVKME